MFLIRVRYFQARRDLQYVFFILLAGLCWLSYNFYSDRYAWHYTGFVLLVLFYIQRNRKDLNFLGRHVAHSYKELLCEYQLLLLPVTIPAFVCGQWLCALALHVGIFALPFIGRKPVETLHFKFLARIIPPSAFEWIAGLRQNLILLVPLYLIACILSPVILFPLIALWLINMIFQSFYLECEPAHMLHATAHNAQGLLSQKIRFGLTLYTLVNLPILLVNVICHPDFLFPDCVFMIYSCISLCLVISMKYSHYEPGQSLQGLAGQMAICNLALLSPYLLPIPALLLLRYYRKAIKKLNFYL